jgi:type IV pilus assembly protein PilA
MSNATERGFTLIELMIVVAIIGILAAIALPQYSDYIKRAKITEAIAGMSACRASVTEWFQMRNALPSGENMFGCERPSGSTTKYVEEIHTHPSGAIHPVMQNIGEGIDGQRLALWPTKADGSLYTDSDLPATIYGWQCGAPTDGTIDWKYLPGSCRQQEPEY